MKKTIAILLLSLYLCFNTGLAINVHYCGGKPSSYSLAGTEQKACKCGKKKMSKSCCKDTKATLSVDDHHQQPQVSFVYPAFVAHLVPQSYYTIPVYSQTIKVSLYQPGFYHVDTGPPKTPLYLQFRKLLI